MPSPLPPGRATNGEPRIPLRTSGDGRGHDRPRSDAVGCGSGVYPDPLYALLPFEVEVTRVACRLLDLKRCRCTRYPERKRLVPDCVVLRPDNVGELSWMPSTCAYRLLAEEAIELEERVRMPELEPHRRGHWMIEGHRKVLALRLAELQLHHPLDPVEHEDADDQDRDARATGDDRPATNRPEHRLEDVGLRERPLVRGTEIAGEHTHIRLDPGDAPDDGVRQARCVAVQSSLHRGYRL